jgi:hypothetical protein
MKILGYILLTVALVGGGVSGFLWRYHLKQARTASAQQQQALSTASEWETSDALDLRNWETRVEKDQIALHNDNLELQIAELEGHSTAPARSKMSTDEMILSADKIQLSLEESTRAFGPSSHVITAQEAATAAHARLAFATEWISRDERFLYFAIGLLVLAGFAFGFASKQGAQTVMPAPERD